MDNTYRSYSSHEKWLFFAILSFCWDIPIFNLTGMNRLNPTFYDIVFFVGLWLFRGQLFSVNISNSTYKLWKYIVYWFCICSFFYFFLTPSGIWLYSGLCAARYVQGLFFVRMFLLVKSDRMFRIVTKATWFGLLIICAYCIYELRHPEIHVVELAGDKTIGMIEENTINGPFESKFEMAQALPLLAIICIAANSAISLFSVSLVGRYNSFLVILLSWPVFYSKSRTAILLFFCSLLLYISLRREGNLWLRMAVIVALLFGSVFWDRIYNVAMRTSSFERIVLLEEGERHDSIEARINVGLLFSSDGYDNRALLPLVGAGFNFAPIAGRDRICYGVHNSILFPFEQAGIVGFVLALVFFIKTLVRLWKQRQLTPWGYPILSFYLALMSAGIVAGQCFWREFNTGNVNTLIIALLCLATSGPDRELSFVRNKPLQ